MKEKPSYEELQLKIKELEKALLEQKLVEDSFLREKRYTASIIDSLPGVFYLFDEEGHFREWNGIFEDITEYSAKEISRISPIDLFVKEDRSLVSQKIQETFTKGRSSVEAVFETKSGKKIRFFFTGRRVFLDNKNYLVGMGIDISELKRVENALRKSNQFLDTIFDSIQDGIIVLDTELNIVRANQTLRKWHARMLPLEGRKCYEIRYGQTEPCQNCPALRALRSGKLAVHEISVTWAGGVTAQLELHAFPMFDDKGNPTGVVEYVRDITKRKQAEKALKKSTEEIINNQKVLLKLAETNYPDLNSALRNITKVSAETLGVERSGVWHFTGDSPEMLCECLYNANHNSYSSGFTLSTEHFPRYFKVLQKSGILAIHDVRQEPAPNRFIAEYFDEFGITSTMDVPIRINGEIVGIICLEHTGPKRRWSLEEKNYAGSIAGMVSLAMEASERKRIQHSLKESEEKYRMLFDLSANQICLYDRDGKILLLNNAAAQHLNGTPDEFIGKTLHDIVPNKANDLVAKHLKVFESGKGIEFEFSDDVPIGKKQYLAKVYPVRNSEGDIFAVQGVANDITALKCSEKKVKESAEKIKRFAYSVSHDIKNPVIGIHWLVRNLNEKYKNVLDEKGKNDLDLIIKASEELSELVGQINTYISTKEAPLDIDTVDLNQIFDTVRGDFSAQILARRINWSHPENLPEINVDRLSILRVLRNFVDNALKYGGDTLSKIEMGYEQNNGFHILSVKDNGVGIGRKESRSIFSPFERSMTSIGIEGSGLGLAIAHEIANLHQGKVWAVPDPIKGVIFYISIFKNLITTSVN